MRFSNSHSPRSQKKIQKIREFLAKKNVAQKNAFLNFCKNRLSLNIAKSLKQKYLRTEEAKKKAAYETKAMIKANLFATFWE